MKPSDHNASRAARRAVAARSAGRENPSTTFPRHDARSVKRMDRFGTWALIIVLALGFVAAIVL